MLAVGVALGLVVGGDVAAGHLEGGPQGRVDLGQCRLHVLGRHSQVVDASAVVALGQLAQGRVAALANVGQQGPDLVDGRFDLGLWARQATTQVAAHATEVESLEHDG